MSDASSSSSPKVSDSSSSSIGLRRGRSVAIEQTVAVPVPEDGDLIRVLAGCHPAVRAGGTRPRESSGLPTVLIVERGDFLEGLARAGRFSVIGRRTSGLHFEQPERVVLEDLVEGTLLVQPFAVLCRFSSFRKTIASAIPPLERVVGGEARRSPSCSGGSR